MIHFNNPKRILVFLKDPNKKNLFVIFKEVFILLLSKKELPLYYFKHLYKKDVTNIKDYLSTGEGARIHTDRNLHKFEHTSIMNNKLNFALFCEKNSLPIPALWGYNLNRSYFLNGKLHTIENKAQLIEYFNEVFESMEERSLFVKPLAEFGGKGCFKLSKENLREQVEQNSDSLLSNGHIFSEVVEQHPAINEIHSNSLNTLRIITYINDNGLVEIVTAFMRFGIGRSVVDNTTSGGLFAGINTKEGKLEDYGYQTMKFGSEKLSHHPESNYKLGGFKIPYFKEACELVISTVDYIPECWIGWDIAITPEGPIIIEANDTPGLHGPDVANSGLLKNIHVKKLVERLNTNNC